MRPTLSRNAERLIEPYGGRLVDLVVTGEERAELLARAGRLPSLQLSPRSLCDLELLATGAFSPVDRFMGAADYGRVLEEMRLADGTLFPIPITLPVGPDAPVAIGTEVALRASTNDVIAVMAVEEIFDWSPQTEARLVCGTTEARHPLVAEMASWGRRYVSGVLRVINLPAHYDFVSLRRTPAEVRARLGALGYANVVAFQTRAPMHRAHEEMTKRAAERVGGALLIHPVVGLARAGDVDHYARVRSYKALVDRYYDRSRTLLSLLPLASRMAGPREALWHAIIRRNHGANHLIVGRDDPAPGEGTTGTPVPGPQESQTLLGRHEDELGVTMVPFTELVWLEDEQRYEEAARVAPAARVASISAAELRHGYLDTGRPLPDWFTRPETAAILSRVSRARHQRGFCVWFTGFSGAGKSTIAEILAVRLMERGREATLLDGDVVRTHLSRGLGFSKEDRDTNILRIGFVAGEIVRHHGVAVCAAVSPYRATRDAVRRVVGGEGFIEVFVDTPLEVCEQRDTKGMYAKARRGEVKGFTGIDDPYEPPLDPELRLTTTDCLPDDSAVRIVRYLIERGFLLDEGDERNYQADR